MTHPPPPPPDMTPPPPPRARSPPLRAQTLPPEPRAALTLPSPPPARRPSRWIKAGSLVLHLVVVLLLLVLPITAAIDLPGIYTTLPPVMLASVQAMPPTPPRGW